ncbi:transcriptional regulator FtsR [Parenemella sanctibonifatiensis]|uniref:HTH merR-type domain-containing protein n=1 Tax=Parenemella sanctibonifatiensis TaxID=2016505 RepID=A0A255E4B0_9ACTN|nr:MerR family transcriptional regulator [Parenemella sanctibonifatiensis]OYN86384.1 hypothetical protein CGZ92_08490 [Parenemella sanctibonifatiensis]
MPPLTRSIGQVLPLLKDDYPDVSISKIRFLESEGLVSPERSPSSGYRRYRESDITRLRYILQMQRDHYLPLKVIREHLDMIDRGMEPPKMDTPAPQAAPAERSPAPRQPVAAKPPLRLSREELMEASGLSEAALIELEKLMILMPRRGTNHYGRDAVTIAVVARRLAQYGMDARHMRVFKQAAEREVGLIQQAMTPVLRRNGGNREVEAEVIQLVAHAHAALMRTARRH